MSVIVTSKLHLINIIHMLLLITMHTEFKNLLKINKNKVSMEKLKHISFFICHGHLDRDHSKKNKHIFNFAKYLQGS
jgi:hypothetical protein